MNAKANFLAKKELAAWWASVAHDSRFTEILTHARSFIMESRPQLAEIQGAERLIVVLETMSDNEVASFEFPSPGLIHNVDKLTAPEPDEPKASEPPAKSKRSKK